MRLFTGQVHYAQKSIKPTSSTSEEKLGSIASRLLLVDKTKSKRFYSLRCRNEHKHRFGY